MSKWKPISQLPPEGEPILVFGKTECELSSRPHDVPAQYVVARFGASYKLLASCYYDVWVLATHWQNLTKNPT